MKIFGEKVQQTLHVCCVLDTTFECGGKQDCSCLTVWWVEADEKSKQAVTINSVPQLRTVCVCWCGGGQGRVWEEVMFKFLTTEVGEHRELYSFL